MTSGIQLTSHNLTPQNQTEMLSSTLTMPHLQPSNRKHSHESLQTKASESGDSLELDTCQCPHSFSTQQSLCTQCGAYFSNSTGRFGLKTNRYSGEGWDIRNLRSSSKQFQIKHVKPLDFVSKDVIEKVSAQFGFSISTQALGVYIYYTAFQGKNQFVQVVVSLFLAAKLMEHSGLKPLRRYRKYLNKCFSYSDYQIMQSYILQKMDFNIAVPTFMDFIYCYLQQGIAISDQICDVGHLQDQMINKAKQILFKGTFMMFPPEVTASNLLFLVRSKASLEQPWNKTIQEITDLPDPYFIFSAENKKIVELV